MTTFFDIDLSPTIKASCLRKVYKYFLHLKLPIFYYKYRIIYFIFLLQTQHVVWVSCEGENPADVENIGSISYYPLQGFPAYYFPFKNIEGYLPPLVAVHFSGPKSKYHFEFH